MAWTNFVCPCFQHIAIHCTDKRVCPCHPTLFVSSFEILHMIVYLPINSTLLETSSFFARNGQNIFIKRLSFVIHFLTYVYSSGSHIVIIQDLNALSISIVIISLFEIVSTTSLSLVKRICCPKSFYCFEIIYISRCYFQIIQNCCSCYNSICKLNVHSSFQFNGFVGNFFIYMINICRFK